MLFVFGINLLRLVMCVGLIVMKFLIYCVLMFDVLGSFGIVLFDGYFVKVLVNWSVFFFL